MREVFKVIRSDLEVAIFHRSNILIFLTSKFQVIFLLYIYTCSLNAIPEREHKLTAVNLASRLQTKRPNESHLCLSNLEM
jgi:hypothetical protein